MELNDLRNLLQKYEEGETSLQEERDLKKYFSSEEVPKSFSAPSRPGLCLSSSSRG